MKLLEGRLVSADDRPPWSRSSCSPWRDGQEILERLRIGMRQPDDKLHLIAASCAVRLPGTAAFMTAATSGVPLPMQQFLRYNHALQERVLLVTVLTSEVPRCADPAAHRDRRGDVRHHASGHAFRLHGIALGALTGSGDAIKSGRLSGIDALAICYVIGRETVIAAEQGTSLAKWRKLIYAFMQRNSERSAVYFGVPAAQAFEIGIEVEI